MNPFVCIALRKLIGAAAAVLLTTALQASATTISYIHTGHGTGTLDGAVFDSDFAITAIADTANVSACGVDCLSNDNSSATIYIAALGVFNLLTPTSYFVSGGVVGFARADGSDLFDGPTVGAWDMASSLSPAIGSAELLQWTLSDVVTTGGVLVFDAGMTASSFVATVGAVPVPAAAWLFGSALIGLAGARRRKS